LTSSRLNNYLPGSGGFSPLRTALILVFCAGVKTLAVLEWAPLYRIFLFIPAQILGFFFSAEYLEQQGIYTFPEFILDYSCSGIHFFMIALIVTLIPPAPFPIKWRRGKKKGSADSLPLSTSWRGGWGVRPAGFLLQCFLAAYLVTLAANTTRVGLFLKLTPFSVGRPWLHELIGTAVFISFLMGFFFAIQYMAASNNVRHGSPTAPPA
jgi:hypothetical protein